MYIPTATLLYSTTYYKILTEKREYIFPRILAFVPRHYVFKRVGVIFEDNVDIKIHSVLFCLEILSNALMIWQKE